MKVIINHKEIKQALDEYIAKRLGVSVQALDINGVFSSANCDLEGEEIEYEVGADIDKGDEK